MKYARIDPYLSPPPSEPPDNSREIAAQCEYALELCRSAREKLDDVENALGNEQPHIALARLGTLRAYIDELEEVCK